jgi:hypothetical protein
VAALKLQPKLSSRNETWIKETENQLIFSGSEKALTNASKRFDNAQGQKKKDK